MSQHADQVAAAGASGFVHTPTIYSVRGKDCLRKSSIPAAQRGSRPVYSNKLRWCDAHNPDADRGPFRLFPVPLPTQLFLYLSRRNKQPIPE